MEIYLPMIDGDVIKKWDKEFVLEMRKKFPDNKRSIKYKQLTQFIYLNIVTHHLSFDNKTSPEIIHAIKQYFSFPL